MMEKEKTNKQLDRAAIRDIAEALSESMESWELYRKVLKILHDKVKAYKQFTADEIKQMSKKDADESVAGDLREHYHCVELHERCLKLLLDVKI